jgi:hypothetical protein
MEDNYANQNDSNANEQDNARDEMSIPGSGKSFKDATPDEVKERVKETVQKGVAAVAGALKGFSEEAQKHNLADSTKEAIQKAGETTRRIVGTTAEELQRTKAHVQEKVKGSSAMDREMGGSASEVGSSPLGGRETSNVRGTSMRDDAMQDVGGARTTGASDVPDLRKTDLGKSDEDLSE